MKIRWSGSDGGVERAWSRQWFFDNSKELVECFTLKMSKTYESFASQTITRMFLGSVLLELFLNQ
jgi:hypothetical protein